MKKRQKVHSSYKQIFCSLIKFAVIQIVIFLFFILMLDMSRSPKLDELIEADIVVDEMLYIPMHRNQRFIIYSGSEKYTFHNLGLWGEYSNSELYDTISKGDKLTITYYEDTHLFKKINQVVSARNKTMVYRSFEEYLESIDGANVGVCVIFAVIEIAFICVLSGYCWFHKTEIKKLKATVKNKRQ